VFCCYRQASPTKKNERIGVTILVLIRKLGFVHFWTESHPKVLRISKEYLQIPWGGKLEAFPVVIHVWFNDVDPANFVLIIISMVLNNQIDLFIDPCEDSAALFIFSSSPMPTFRQRVICRNLRGFGPHPGFDLRIRSGKWRRCSSGILEAAQTYVEIDRFFNQTSCNKNMHWNACVDAIINTSTCNELVVMFKTNQSTHQARSTRRKPPLGPSWAREVDNVS
jgi:hypothetical protein